MNERWKKMHVKCSYKMEKIADRDMLAACLQLRLVARESAGTDIRPTVVFAASQCSMKYHLVFND